MKTKKKTVFVKGRQVYENQTKLTEAEKWTLFG